MQIVNVEIQVPKQLPVSRPIFAKNTIRKRTFFTRVIGQRKLGRVLVSGRLAVYLVASEQQDYPHYQVVVALSQLSQNAYQQLGSVSTMYIRMYLLIYFSAYMDACMQH